MKTLTEFNAFDLKASATQLQELTAAGKTPEEIQAAFTELKKFEGDKLKIYMSAMDIAKARPEGLKRVVVFTAVEGEKVPASAEKREEHYYLAEFFPSAQSAQRPEREFKGGKGKDRGKGGRNSRGRDGGREGGREGGRGPGREGGRDSNRPRNSALPTANPGTGAPAVSTGERPARPPRQNRPPRQRTPRPAPALPTKPSVITPVGGTPITLSFTPSVPKVKPLDQPVASASATETPAIENQQPASAETPTVQAE